MFWNGLDHMISRLESITWSSLVLIIYFCCLWSYDLVNKHTFDKVGIILERILDGFRACPIRQKMNFALFKSASLKTSLVGDLI